MRGLILLVFIIIPLLRCNLLFSDEFNPKTASGSFHYSGKYCNECHKKIPKKNDQNLYLKFNGDFDLLCKCHLSTPDSYIHPVDIKPSREKKLKIPPSFPLKNGKVVCGTCHDISLQCQESLFDKHSLRGSPYQTRYDACFLCHNSKEYEMLNPHKQLDANKKIIEDQCLYCHIEKPNEKYSGSRDITLKSKIAVLCQRCHNIKGKHAGNANHFRKPSAKGIKRMNAMKEKYNIILPLDSEGKLTCATCHNPHEKGVIEAEKPSAKGADDIYRHRVPGKMCTECHQM